MFVSIRRVTRILSDASRIQQAIWLSIINEKRQSVATFWRNSCFLSSHPFEQSSLTTVIEPFTSLCAHHPYRACKRPIMRIFVMWMRYKICIHKSNTIMYLIQLLSWFSVCFSHSLKKKKKQTLHTNGWNKSTRVFMLDKNTKKKYWRCVTLFVFIVLRNDEMVGRKVLLEPQVVLLLFLFFYFRKTRLSHFYGNYQRRIAFNSINWIN